MVEIQITRLEYAHDLDALDGFSMERNGGLLHQLANESLHGNIRYLEVAALHQSIQSVDECIGPEKRLLE